MDNCVVNLLMDITEGFDLLIIIDKFHWWIIDSINLMTDQFTDKCKLSIYKFVSDYQRVWFVNKIHW